MRKLVLIPVILLLTGCGLFTTGNGVFDGRLVDVSWEGLIFKSCEVTFQFGENSSSRSEASTLSKSACDEFKSKVGQTIRVEYDEYVNPCCLRTGSRYILK